jgi:hypothetical protein
MKIQMTRSPLWTLLGLLACVSTHAQGVQQAALGQNIGVLRSTELRSDKLAAATVLQNLPAGATLRWLGLEGGWAQVQTQDPSGMTRTGWVRASAVNLSAEPSAAASLTNGRLASGNAVLTLGVRGMPSRANRHALIIGVGRYADPATPPLPGTKIDKQCRCHWATSVTCKMSRPLVATFARPCVI